MAENSAMLEGQMDFRSERNLFHDFPVIRLRQRHGWYGQQQEQGG
jgi:hypothetical protein